MSPRVLVVIGTRPEAIKLAPIVRIGRQRGLDIQVCFTGQHREMVEPILEFFAIQADHQLGLMRQNQGLADLLAAVVSSVSSTLMRCAPQVVIVQGDTTTALGAALAAFYAHIPVAHVEAGLRTGDLSSPFPEEANRALISRVATWHFAPTSKARDNLAREGVTENVHVVGNTVVDALNDALSLAGRHEQTYVSEFRFLDPAKRLVLVTGHRRESFGAPFEQICGAIRDIADERADVQIVYPVHLNPNVRGVVHTMLHNRERVHLIEPVDYPRMVWLLQRCHLVLTDSGGVQEEAPSLGKPVLVMRDVTERQEGLEAGVAMLVGTDRARIRQAVLNLLDDPVTYAAMSSAENPYGDGHSTERIIDVLVSDADDA